MNQDDVDEALGITRCARCGHRLQDEIECPFCSLFPEKPLKPDPPKWLFVTACFLTSPLSLYSIITVQRLTIVEKMFAFSGCLLWFSLYRLFF